MQVVYTGEIKGEFADAWDQRYDFARLDVRLEFRKLAVDFCETRDAKEFSTDRGEDFGELFLGISIGNARRGFRQRQHWRGVAAQGREDGLPAVHFASFLSKSRKLWRGIGGSSR
jgi:hypothetical protein